MKLCLVHILISMAIWLSPVAFNPKAVLASNGSDGSGVGASAVPHSTPPNSGGDLTVSMARGTWDTGWFQAEIFKQLIESLGYSVTGPQTMENQAFYLAVARGEIDLWPNSWLPLQDFYLEDPRVKDRVEPVGFQVKAGALQGYLIDQRSAKALGIRNLKALKDPNIARHFDRDGNGKADLIGCNTGWACAQEIERHLGAYGLNDTVEQIQGEYSPMMTDTVDRYKQGKPVLFYSWTPNWTIGALAPGRDVVWLEVPFASLPQGQKGLEHRIKISNITGCESDPCAMGFVPSDIRVVANKAFLAQNPAVKRLVEHVVIPRKDINAQNAMMMAGEDSEQDLQRHAKAWIHKNRPKVEQWIKTAKAALQPGRITAAPILKSEKETKVLRVVTKPLAPFVTYENRRYIGFSIELWQRIAREMNVSYELYGVNSFAKLLDEVRRQAADVAIGGIGITSNREQFLDFSHPFFTSGFQIMVPRERQTPIGAIFLRVFSILLSPELMSALGLFLIVLIFAAHIIWIMERRHNPDFSEGYFNGLWQSIWWALVTVTTVGYGDKTPKGKMGRLFGMVWILAGYFVLAYFMASVTSTVTVRELQGAINGPEDLFGKRVATVEKCPAADYLAEQGIFAVQLPTIENAYDLLEAKKVDAIVYDAPVLQHYASKQGKSKAKVVGLMFKEQSYGIVLQADSPYREEINTVLLRLMEKGVYKEIHGRWFGS